jgi:predicted GIY-YIG superfamily endonuclease
MITNLRIGSGIYYLYIVTNPEKTVLEIASTGDLTGKISQLEYEHSKAKGNVCSKLVYLEKFDNIDLLIDRENEFKRWPRYKLLSRIYDDNPHLHFLNENIGWLGLLS